MFKSFITNNKKNSENTLFQGLNEARDKNSENSKKFENDYNLIFNQGITLFKDFVDDTRKSKNTLQEAAEAFGIALKLKRNKAEPYFYLAYIFYLLKDQSLAIKYLQCAKVIDPDLPGMSILEKNICSI
jgi:tetratricopeptide (TPR) repeat protein